MFNKIIYNPRLTLSYIYAGSLCLLYTNGCYVFITNNNEDITIAKKYKYVANGFTNFMVVDDKGRHFNVNNNFWHFLSPAFIYLLASTTPENKFSVS